MEFKPYHKISGPWNRCTEKGPSFNKLIPDSWSKPEFEYLQDTDWVWTEKLDGTNVRVCWDGYRVEFRGRTDRATLPGGLAKHLAESFPEELMEQVFQDKPVTIFGEGVGPGIQKVGSQYSDHQKFVMFDVYFHTNNLYAKPQTVTDISESLNCERATEFSKALSLNEAIWAVREGLWAFTKEGDRAYLMEGLIGVPAVPMFNQFGERVIVKVKSVDLFEGAQ